MKKEERKKEEEVKKELEKTCELLYFIKSYEKIEAVNGNYSILDEVERLDSILGLIDRDWGEEAQKIQELNDLFFNGKHQSTQIVLKKWTEITLSLSTLFAKLAEKRGFIMSTHYAYEQLFCYLEGLEETEIHKRDLEKLENIPDKEE